jgi:hypothetical protein
MEKLIFDKQRFRERLFNALRHKEFFDTSIATKFDDKAGQEISTRSWTIHCFNLWEARFEGILFPGADPGSVFPDFCKLINLAVNQYAERITITENDPDLSIVSKFALKTSAALEIIADVSDEIEELISMDRSFEIKSHE